ncbi:retinol dehydrogenase 7-like, partial [Scleropages formosus]
TLLSNLFLSCLLATVGIAALVWYIRDSRKVDCIHDKHVFVTGCDSGFGNLLACQLDQKGFRVIAACLTEKGATSLRASASSRLKTILLDVTDSVAIDRAVEVVRGEVGGRGLWGLVNNAGRSMPIGLDEWMQLEDFQKVLAVNLIGMIEVTLKFLPLLKKAQGRVVNVASVLGRLSVIGGGYCLSKWGVEAFSDGLRREMQFWGMKVSIIEPGYFKTEVTRLDLIEANMERLWHRLPAEVAASYGEKYVEKFNKVQRFYMNILCSSDLSKVTWCMEHALTARHPRTRYGAGWDAKLFWIPLSYFPAFITDLLLRAILPTPSVK